MQQFDDTDTRLLSLLRSNARRPVSSLASELGIARTTVQARLERLERSGAIKGYTLREGAQSQALIRATALVSIEPRSGPNVLALLKRLSQVERVHTVSGRFDMIVQIAAKDTETLDAALDEIGATRGVRSSESLIHLSTKIERAPL
ncbi:Lrp/AsnC family transcriptional regulator [Planktotalea arctica]|uniref:Lrp/AsnC family transcriptional regulator n=1 Tax=Planktotalea arctica TaxID=1481893 RepID=UPI00321A3AC3